MRRRRGSGPSARPTCCARWVELGLLGMLVPEEWGGIGMSTVGFVAALEQLGHADQSVAAAFQAHVTIGSMPLFLFGNDDQRERWLRPLAEGRVLGAFGLTEPDAGSDMRGISTRAVHQDGGWLINGRKAFISNAGTDMSFGVTLLARTDTADDGRAMFGSFVVEKDTPGFTMGAEDARHRLEGPRHARAVLRRRVGRRRAPGGRSEARPRPVPRRARGRPHLDRRAVAQPDPGGPRPVDRVRQAAPPVRQADLAVSRRSSSSWPTSPPNSKPPAGSRTARRTCATPASRSSRRRRWPSSRRAASPRAAASEAVQIHGGVGYMLESPVARFYCDSKVLEIGEGTNEIQHVVIARELGC